MVQTTTMPVVSSVASKIAPLCCLCLLASIADSSLRNSGPSPPPLLAHSVVRFPMHQSHPPR